MRMEMLVKQRKCCHLEGVKCTNTDHILQIEHTFEGAMVE